MDYIARQLVHLARKPENRTCADCSVPLEHTVWAVLPHGAFVCRRCSLVHEALGPEVSRPRALDSGDWTREELDLVRRNGNSRVNEVLEHYIPKGFVKPGSDARAEALEVWIRAKYERRDFMTPWNDKATLNLGALRGPRGVVELPKRFLDYYFVLSLRKDVASGSAPTALPVPPVSKRRDADEDADAVEPLVVDRFPREDYPDFPLDKNVTKFCGPALLQLARREERDAVLTRFVLTDVQGARVYACALVFCESTDTPDSPSRAASVAPSSGGVVKGLCLLSHYPFFRPMEVCLQQLVRITVSSPPLPFERFVSSVVAEVPLPPRGRMRLQLTIADATLLVSRPPPNKLPHTDAEYSLLFSLLSAENVLRVFSLLLTESKVAFHSSNPSLLCPVMEAVQSLLFPFRWQMAYVPLLPADLVPYLDAPMSFLFGLHTEDVPPLGRRPPTVGFVDLDAGTVDVGVDEEGAPLPPPVYPEHEWDKLEGHVKAAVSLCKPSAEARAVLHERYGRAFARGPLAPVLSFALEGGVTLGTDSHADQGKGSSGHSLRSRFRNMGRSADTTKLRSVADLHVPCCSVVTAGHDDGGGGGNGSGNRSSRAGPTESTASTGGQGGDSEVLESVLQGKEVVEVGQLRAAFLRFFTAILRDYRSFFTAKVSRRRRPSLGGKESLHIAVDFDRDRFVAAQPKEAHEAMERLAESQMFQLFLQDRTVMHEQLVTDADRERTERVRQMQAGGRSAEAEGEPTSSSGAGGEGKEGEGEEDLPGPDVQDGATTQARLQLAARSPTAAEVVFFDECIAAKHNRSSVKTRTIPTPFLQSTDNDFRTTFMTPTPDTRGVPVDATFHYRKFPLMDPANIARCAASGGKGGLSALTQQRAPTSIRHPRPLVSESEFSRLSRSDAASTTAVLASFGQAKPVPWQECVAGVARIQALYRGHRMRCRWLQMQDAARRLSTWWRASNAHRERRRRARMQEQAAMTVQRVFRGSMARAIVAKRRRATRVLQRYWRAVASVLFFRAFRRRVTLWQALARRFLATRRYRRQLRAAIAVQALYRGVSGRRRVRSLCSERLASLKPAIAAQWRDLHVALQYRSSLWRSLVHPTPVTVAVARMELAELEETTAQHGANTRRRSVRRRKSNGPAHSLVEGSLRPRGLEWVSDERAQLYAALKEHLPDDQRTQLFSLFDMGPRDKKRKRRVAQLVWQSAGDEDRSAEVVFTCYPPLYAHDGAEAVAMRCRQAAMREVAACAFRALAHTQARPRAVAKGPVT